MTNDLSNRPGRGGITINDRGDQGTVGFWPEKFDGSTGWLGGLRNQFGEAVRIAQRHHIANEEKRAAKNKGQPAVLPEFSVRQAISRAEQKKLDAIEAHVAKISDDAFRARSALKPFDYGDAADRAMELRKELRAHLRSVPEKERVAMLKTHAYREAVLEQRAEISGLPQSQYDLLREAELAQKFPDVIAGTADAMEGVEIVLLALKTARRAVEAELQAAGSTVAEPAIPAPAKAWA